MRKKFVWGVLLLFSVALVWYLFIKPNDYQVTFKIKAIPGIVNQSIKLWANGLDHAQFKGQKDWQHFTHELQFNDSIHRYEWKVQRINDSISQVKVWVTDTKHSLANKIAIPFAETDFEKRTIATVKDLITTLKEHTKSFKVSSFEISEIPSKYCVYVPLASKQTKKALQMMENYSFLNQIIAKNELQPDGAPFIEVEKWYKDKDSITFNFCYPVHKPDSLPTIKNVFFKKIAGQKAIKSVYNGNYITSDRAWYHLLEFAKKNKLTVEENPFEVFHNNPNIGGDELKWKTDVYLPIIE